MNQRSRLTWRCRRGIREMDILLLGYFESYYDHASTDEQNIFAELLEEADLDILSWITQRTLPDEKYTDLLNLIRKATTNAKNNPVE